MEHTWPIRRTPRACGRSTSALSQGGRAAADLGGRRPAAGVEEPTGNESFFVSGNDLMAVDVVPGPVFRVGTPNRLFGGEAIGTRLSLPRYVEHFFDVAPDGRHFVVVKGLQMGQAKSPWQKACSQEPGLGVGK